MVVVLILCAWFLMSMRYENSQEKYSKLIQIYIMYYFPPKMLQSPENAALECENNSPWIGKFGDGDSTQYFIFVEKQPLCNVNNLCRGLFLWFSAHYIFHLQYIQLQDKGECPVLPGVCLWNPLFLQKNNYLSVGFN